MSASQPNGNNGWKQYFMGVLLLLSMAFGGAAYSQTTNRITKLENERDRIDELRIAIAQLQLQQDNILQWQRKADSKIDELLANSRDTNKIYRQNTQVWNEKLQRWEQIVQQAPPPRR